MVFFRHHQFRANLVLIMLTSWLFMLLSSTCAMSMPLKIPQASNMPKACAASEHHGNVSMPDSKQKLDCTLKACPDSQPNPAFTSKIDRPDIPVFILCLTWLGTYIFNQLAIRFTRPEYRRPATIPIPIRYRFCTFLN